MWGSAERRPFRKICFQRPPQGIPIGSSIPQPADSRNRAGGILEMGYPLWDIPPLFLEPCPSTRDRKRFVPEANRHCLVSGGPQPSSEPPVRRYSSTRSIPPFRPGERLRSDIHCRGYAPFCSLER